ncbi:Kynurenine 3-monooxygenase [Paramicrosporidium saccamoebae]|uniref:Kynurenine 3-monooxygenase n=1 Tax=Paramicrosporidium saccamoebae TaxID=1246581 RepID=A0A2H9TGJ3_9FUNG|nr:Kynurenine 3-monooxygenase [Paramicrosporidium saccamoebae]
MTEQNKVVIVGAGLVGSLAAIYMARLGHNVVVYEKRPGRSINLALSTRGILALKDVGLDKLVLDLAIPMKGRMLHSADGKSTSVVINSVSRRGLNEILLNAAEELENVEFHFEQELQTMDANTGTLSFLHPQTGAETIETADFILGCDGAFSAVRREMLKFARMDFAQSYVPHGYKEFSILPDEKGDWKMPLNYLHIWPRGQFMLIALPNPVKSSSDVKTLFQTHFPDALELIGEDRVAQEYTKNPVGSLVTMKVLLLGDAAHAVVPFYGQGMNAGFEDLTVLSQILTEVPDRLEAFQKYSTTRNPDAHAIADLALYNYWEMSTAMTSRLFKLKRSLYAKLHKLMPKIMVPLYSMVAFSSIPYAEVIRRADRQETIANFIFGGLGASVLAALGLSLRRLCTQ